ncbi:Gap-Pol polyprotein [Schistosoma japonicum]|nr:Gap-Pol polyprotein [Schistosoma japonicum]
MEWLAMAARRFVHQGKFLDRKQLRKESKTKYLHDLCHLALRILPLMSTVLEMAKPLKDAGTMMGETTVSPKPFASCDHQRQSSRSRSSSFCAEQLGGREHFVFIFDISPAIWFGELICKQQFLVHACITWEVIFQHQYRATVDFLMSCVTVCRNGVPISTATSSKNSEVVNASNQSSEIDKISSQALNGVLLVLMEIRKVFKDDRLERTRAA